ncbi:MAG: phosphatidylserine decarboxylase [Clostridia bacterium]|nr:phosphatidylserine decarboxylase [Clostridia bacterium]
MIKLYNRSTKGYDIEKVAGGGMIGSLYNSKLGKAGLELLVKRKIFSVLTGLFCDRGISAGRIKRFVEDYNIDMGECPHSVDDFRCFNDFFTRKLKSEARPFNSDTSLLLSPGDGRLRVWKDIDIDKLVQVKGITYSLKELLADEKLAEKYRGGVCMILRLAPVDYHRFHFIDRGTCTESKRINGFYYSVNPVALNSIPRAFCMNKREYSILHSDNYGDVLYMEVGATSVGSIVQTYKPNAKLKRGDEKGYFKFGGSTVILFMEKGTVAVDEDILEQTDMDLETRVLAGEVIGKKLG